MKLSLILPGLLAAQSVDAFTYTPMTHQGVTFSTSTHQSPLYAARKKSSDDDTDLTASNSKSQGNNKAKLSALEGVLSRIERNYGRGSIVKLGDADRMVVDCVGSGSLTLGELVVGVSAVYPVLQRWCFWLDGA